MILQHNECRLKEKIIRENGGGIAVVIWGVTVMLVFIFTAINILNAKLIEEEYNRLRDSVQSAATGSVIHLLYDEEQATDIKTENGSDVVLQYDAYLQLALGYIINYDNQNSTNDDSTVISTEENNFIKLDHKKVVNSTMELIFDTVLPGADRKADAYQILMMFIEPIYDENYHKGFNVVVYTNRNGSASGTIYPVFPQANTNMNDLYLQLQETINSIVNDNNIFQGRQFSINLNVNGENEDHLIQAMRTNPYYLIVVKDFALPTIFSDQTTRNDNIFTSISGNGRLTQPIAVLQSGNVERRIDGADSR